MANWRPSPSTACSCSSSGACADAATRSSRSGPGSLPHGPFAVALLLPYMFLFIATLHISDYVSYRDIFHADEAPTAAGPTAVPTLARRRRGGAIAAGPGPALMNLSPAPPRPALPAGCPGWRSFATIRARRFAATSFAGLSAFLVMIPSVLAYSELDRRAGGAGALFGDGSDVGYALLSRGTPVIAGPDATTALLAAAVVAPVAGGDPGGRLCSRPRWRSSSGDAYLSRRGSRSATSRTCCRSRCWSATSTARR